MFMVWLLLCFKAYQIQCMGGTRADTGWFQSRVDTIVTKITFHCFASLWILDGNIPGAGSGAGHAANARVAVNVNNTIFALDHCSGGADINAEWFFAVTTGLKGEI
jgi:hypothetical protein